MSKLKIKLKHEQVKLPTYSTMGAGCFDIRADDCANENKVNLENDWKISIPPNSSVVFCTGLFFEVPEGKVLMVYSRSGHGFNSDIRLANCVGVIDSDYRGELKVKLTNDSSEWEFIVQQGDRIAQAMLIDVEQVQFEVVDELTETERGTGGLGSTGVK